MPLPRSQSNPSPLELSSETRAIRTTFDHWFVAFMQKDYVEAWKYQQHLKYLTEYAKRSSKHNI